MSDLKEPIDGVGRCWRPVADVLEDLRERAHAGGVPSTFVVFRTRVDCRYDRRTADFTYSVNGDSATAAEAAAAIERARADWTRNAP